ncbi:MAG: type VI secretion system baseplate subunit TssE [Pseudomonadota bacterium]
MGGAHPGIRAPQPRDAGQSRAQAHLLPTLFDRLRDEAPSRSSESPSDYAATPTQMREIIQRDLGFLLNTTNAEDLIDRARFPDAAASTINFGVPPLAGSYLSAHRWADIERIIRRAIADHEPRLRADSVTVRPLAREGASDPHNVLLFEIRALIDLRPYPLELMVQSTVDLETGRVRIAQPMPGTTRAIR